MPESRRFPLRREGRTAIGSLLPASRAQPPAQRCAHHSEQTHLPTLDHQRWARRFEQMRMNSIRRHDRDESGQLGPVEGGSQADDGMFVGVAKIRAAHRMSVPLADVCQQAAGPTSDLIERFRQLLDPSGEHVRRTAAIGRGRDQPSHVDGFLRRADAADQNSARLAPRTQCS
jgi:hypothetical protein